MNPKLFIVILVILVIIFVGGVVIGANQDEGGGEVNFFDSSLAQDIRSRFSTRVRLDEIGLNNGASPNGCLLQGKQMAVPGGVILPCQLDIDAADEGDSDSVRTMSLHFANGPAGTTLQVRLEQPNSDKALTVNKDLAFGEKLDLEVYEGSARLKITGCPRGNNSAVFCVVNLTVGDAAN
jgi:hypothetical protein